MYFNSKLCNAIATILSGTGIGLAYATSAASAVPGANDGDAIQEITVTAQRRTENLQDVPITIQVLTGDTLKALNVTTLDDFIKYLPNVTQASNGPSQSNIFMRGLSVGVSDSQGSGSFGEIPNVAVYLDEQSASLPGRNLDVYAADLERIEVLEGPQGTLFGSGAEAGVLRYITNKPRLGLTEGVVNAGYSYTAHGAPNSDVNATLNVPLIPDTLAVRAVVYNDSRGGYIRNLPSTFSRASTDEGIVKYNGGVVPTNSLVINNNSDVGNAINPLTYKGLRLSLLYKVNEEWNALLTQSYQTIDAQGVFYEMPFGSEGTTFDAKGKPIGSIPLPHLSVNLFNPSYDHDQFENTALQVNGRIGDLKAVYSGGYLVRNVDQVGDYTNYSRGVFSTYYQCAGISPTSAAAGACYTPSTTWRDTEKNTHQSHEIRLSTPDDWRIRAIGGVYYEHFVITEENDWQYRTVPTCMPLINVNCFNNIQPFPGAFTTNPGVRNDNVAALFNFQRTINQKAAFGSIDVDLFPKTLTFTAGTRFYRFDEEELGDTVFSFGCFNAVPTSYFGGCKTAAGTNVNLQNPHTSVYSGFRSRANLSWKITDEIMAYYTWSQGFRPGGFNFGTNQVLPGADGKPQYITPATYAPDSLTNNELGWKSLIFNRHLQIDGAVYQENWNNTQTNFFDPQDGLGNTIFATNGPKYRVRGAELQIVARIAAGLTVQASTSYNDGRQTNSPALLNNNPQSATFGQRIAAVVSAYGPAGSRLAESPLLQWNIRVHDDVQLGDYNTFWQIGAQHIGDSQSATGNIVSYDQPSYTTYDASLGVAKGSWSTQFFVQNLTSVNASTGTNASQFVEGETVTRPRIAGIKIGYRF